MNFCNRIPCGMTSGGCTYLDCPNRPSPSSYPPTTYPNMAPVQTMPLSFPPQGCICPPTSEQTCENPYCPRQNPLTRGTKKSSDGPSREE